MDMLPLSFIFIIIHICYALQTPSAKFKRMRRNENGKRKNNEKTKENVSEEQWKHWTRRKYRRGTKLQPFSKYYKLPFMHFNTFAWDDPISIFYHHFIVCTFCVWIYAGWYLIPITRFCNTLCTVYSQCALYALCAASSFFIVYQFLTVDSVTWMHPDILGWKCDWIIRFRCDTFFVDENVFDREQTICRFGEVVTQIDFHLAEEKMCKLKEMNRSNWDACYESRYANNET